MKKYIIYSLYGFCLILMIAVVVTYNNVSKDAPTAEILTDYDYVYDILNSTVKEVNNESQITVIKPYINKDVKIVKNYYDYKSEEKEQQNSIMYYDGTYMQSTGISYGAKDSFEVVSVLPGEVTEVLEDKLVGNSITIKHDDNTYSVYQSIKDIKVSKGDKVSQGDVLATTGTSNISQELNNHLYFELIVNGKCVNPEEYYDSAL